MLQCTAVTSVPEIDALVAMVTMQGAPGDPPSTLYLLGDMVLCELGEDEHTEHAAMICMANTDEPQALWLFWTGEGSTRHYALEERPECPAEQHPGSGRGYICVLFDKHPAVHSWVVTDPLGTILRIQARGEVDRLFRKYPEGDPD
ncbi:hypothetical protein OG730_14990 [Streptomyces sp. NBC_01298]|uniref:hypothetical protein n=1 Tax=Streptomyces sp. NBC_01298 TaxID=2903817 RepID=UPI002E160CDD|nr:hypothetical protein OG730_14990 [Streptomyces sp. NBC_01298]